MPEYLSELRKRYWVFSIPGYYPSGGLYDVVATFNSEEDAVACALEDYERIVFDSKEFRYVTVDRSRE